MSRIRPEEVREIAALARLALTDHEIARMTQDLDSILGYVEALRALDTTATEPMTHAVPFDCPLRLDTEEPALTADEALRNAPRREQNFFQVPAVLPSADPGSGIRAAAAAAGAAAAPAAGAEES